MLKTCKKFFRTSDSVISLVIGVAMVIIIGMLSYSIISTVREQNRANKEMTKNEPVLPTTYTVKKGDTLWDISLTYYKSGYNWVDIASTNELDNPDALAIGQTLTIPNVSPITLTEQGDILNGVSTDTVTPRHSEVTVAQGESLWKIAEREYGTGYKWVDIVKANSIIVDPNIIYPNTILRLP
ncbi:MAG: LysM peptidoglycan-binding domain-containing protein [Candidatus Gottesmanbacteria bacterium]